MVQHLSIPLLLSYDALGASKDTPVSGSICRELKAGFFAVLLLLDAIGFADLPWKCIPLCAYLGWLIILNFWEKSGLRFPKISQVTAGVQKWQVFCPDFTETPDPWHLLPSQGPDFLAVLLVLQAQPWASTWCVTELVSASGFLLSRSRWNYVVQLSKHWREQKWWFKPSPSPENRSSDSCLLIPWERAAV